MITLQIHKANENSIIKEDRIFLRVSRKNYFNVISLTKQDIKELLDELPDFIINNL